MAHATESVGSAFQKSDYLLIAGVVAAPMTEARIGLVGPGELLVTLWILSRVPSLLRSRTSIPAAHIAFWLTFVGASVLGTMVGTMVVRNPSTEVGGLIVWVYLGSIAVGTLAGLVDRSREALETILRRISICTAAWYGLLLVCALVISPSLFGIPLWFTGVAPADVGDVTGGRFAGGANNPHQLGVLIAVVLGLLLRQLIRGANTRTRIGIVLQGAVALAIGLATRSSTLLASLALTLLVAVVILIWRSRVSAIERMFRTILLAIGIVVASPLLLDSADRFVRSDANGLGRFELWSDFAGSLERSGYMGLGPGPHALNGSSEFHNSILDATAMAGLIGGLALVGYLGYVLTRLTPDPLLLLAVVPLLGYGMAGFSYRRLVFWAILMILVSIADRIRSTPENSPSRRLTYSGTDSRRNRERVSHQ